MSRNYESSNMGSVMGAFSLVRSDSRPIYDLFRQRRKKKKKEEKLQREKRKKILKSHRSRKKSRKYTELRYDNEISILHDKYCFRDFIPLKVLWNKMEQDKMQKQKEQEEWLYFNVPTEEEKEEDKRKVEEKRRKDEKNRQLWYEYLLQHTGILR